MISQRTAPLVRVTAPRSVLRTAAVALAVAVIPITFAVNALCAPSHTLLLGGILELLAIAACVALGARQLLLFTEVDATELRGNGFITATERVPLHRVAHVHLVPTMSGQDDLVHQLLVTDSDGVRLFRMRGNFWPPDGLERIANALPVPVTRVSEPMSLREFWQTYPGSAYWFENRRNVIIAATIVAVALVVGVTALTRATLG